MGQLSLPYRIALLAIATMGVIWFVALRPGSDPAPATAPGVTGLATATQKARDAVAQSDKSVAATEAAAGQVDPTTPATGSQTQTPIVKAPASGAGTSKPKQSAVKDLSGPILADLRNGHVAVIAFAGDSAADDRGVRAALRGIDRLNGKVVVRAVDIADVADYGAITRGVQVQQAPTVLVIGKNHKARSIVGFTDAHEINQLVGDVG